MKVTTKWNEKMTFTGSANEHSVRMDTRSPMGSDSAMSPKQLLLASVSGCTAMDVVSLLKKFRQPLQSLEMDAEADLTEGSYPSIFKEIHLSFRARGEIEGAKLLEAVHLSQTKYCGVSAMIAQTVPIRYTVELNQEVIGEGRAHFELPNRT